MEDIGQIQTLGAYRGEGRISVLGIGNTLMGDDGVGVSVVQGFDAASLGQNVCVVSGATVGMGLIGHFLDSDLVIIIDAVYVEAEPGAIFRFHPDEAGMGTFPNHAHGLGISHLLTTARLKGANPEVLVYGIQAEAIRLKDRELNPSVARAAEKVGKMVFEEIRSRRQFHKNK